jgi:hypothetical protein
VAGAFEMRLGGVGQRGKSGGRCGRVRVDVGVGGEEVLAWRSAAAPGRRARAVPLPREQGRVADAATRANVADEWDRGEAGPGGSGRVRGRRRESEAGRLWGADTRPRAAQCRAARFKPDFKQILNSNVSNKFQIVLNFGLLEKYFLGLRKIEIKYGF